MGEEEMTEFLTHLAGEGNVAASTQNQALSALLFLYKEVLKQDIGWLENVERVKRPARLRRRGRKKGTVCASCHLNRSESAPLSYLSRPNAIARCNKD